MSAEPQPSAIVTLKTCYPNIPKISSPWILDLLCLFAFLGDRLPCYSKVIRYSDVSAAATCPAQPRGEKVHREIKETPQAFGTSSVTLNDQENLAESQRGCAQKPQIGSSRAEEVTLRGIVGLWAIDMTH